MRALLFAGAALFAAPVAAQDHSGHHGHADHAADHAQQPESAEHHDHHQGAPPAEAREEHSAHHGGDHAAHQQQADHAQMDHSQHEAPGGVDHSAHDAMPAELDIPFGPPPPEAFAGPDNAADAIWGSGAMAIARRHNHEMHGNQRFSVFFGERFEVRVGEDHNEYLWDVQAWYGTPTNRAVIKSEGEGAFGGELDDAEVQMLVANAIGPWFDLEAGVRVDAAPDPTAHLVLGVQGLTPYMVHLDAAAFLSLDGDLTARIEAEHDVRLTQKLVLQPRMEAELSAQDIPERGIGAGLFKLETGLRLRYEFVPEFAPYLGIEYEAATGRTAELIRAEGEDPDGLVFLIGLRAWF